MKKLITVLAAGVLMAGTAVLVLWLQLRDERERGEELAAPARTPAPVAAARMADPISDMIDQGDGVEK